MVFHQNKGFSVAGKPLSRWQEFSSKWFLLKTLTRPIQLRDLAKIIGDD